LLVYLYICANIKYNLLTYLYISYYGRCDFNQIKVGKTFFWSQFGTL